MVTKKNSECYKPHAEVKSFISKLLQLESDKRELKRKLLEGEITVEEEKLLIDDIRKQRDNLIPRKTEVLNNYIFPAMADLTYFLECTSGPELSERFEKDIQSLFFAKSTVNNDNMPIIKRLIKASIIGRIAEDIVIAADNGKLKTEPKKALLPEYRLVVAEMMLTAIWEQIIGGVGHELHKDLLFPHEVMEQDIGRAKSWIAALASNGHKTVDKFEEVRRPARF
jgi:hypothetical protein